MNDFSLLVRIKYDALDSQQKRMFDEEYKRRKKPFEDDYNSDLALEILRDISMMFSENESSSEDKNVSKRNVDPYYFDDNRSSGESYSIFILVGVIILFGVVAFFTKPERVNMQNKIVDDVMITQPKIAKVIMNLFIGEELTEKYSNNFINNLLSRNGYKNIGIYEEDYVILRKLDFRDEDSKESVITAYGIFGFTKVIFNYNKIELSKDKIIGNSQNTRNYNGYVEKEYHPKKYENTSYNYDSYNTSIEENKSTKIKDEPKKMGDPLGWDEDTPKEKKKSEPKEDSIKI